MLFKYLISSLILISFLAIISPLTIFAQITVEVSNIYSAIHYTNVTQLTPGTSEIIELQKTPKNDKYKMSLQTKGGQIHLVVIDGRDIASDNPKPIFLMEKIISNGTSFIDFPQVPSQEGVAVVLLNNTKTSIDLNINVFRIGERTDSTTRKVREWLEIPIKALDSVYVLPKFKVEVKPCGCANAFSNPNIVICTELFADLTEKHLIEALYPILFHEMAHSLLYIWELPGYDNEDLADEFAALLAKYSQNNVNAYIKWLESNDSVTEAVVQLINGDKHTISIQRARNMKSALVKPDELLRRWGKLLKPFQRSL